MKIAKVQLVGVSPYSQSKHYTTPKKDKETPDAYERRTWRDRMHVTKDGYVEIPAMAFPNCWRASAARLGIKVPGKRNATFTKSFDSGILVLEPLKLAILAADVACDELFVPSDGKPGGGSRVTKLFPRIDEWSGEVTFHILDDHRFVCASRKTESTSTSHSAPTSASSESSPRTKAMRHEAASAASVLASTRRPSIFGRGQPAPRRTRGAPS